MATPQITRHSVAPPNSQYFSIQKKSSNGVQRASHHHHHPVQIKGQQHPVQQIKGQQHPVQQIKGQQHPVQQIKGIPGPGRLPFSIPPCAISCPFDLFRRSFPFPGKQFLSPLNSQRTPTDWCERKSSYFPKIIHCPPSPSLNPKKTTYEELKGICTSDLVLPLPKQPSPCDMPIPVSKKRGSKGSSGKAKKKAGNGSGSDSKSSPYGSYPYGSGKGSSYPYGYTSPPQSGYGQIEGAKKDSNELSGYWPSGGSYVPKEVRMKQQQAYGYSYPPYPYGDAYPYSDDGYSQNGSGPSNSKSSDETESEVCHRGAGASRSDEGLDFVFNPDNDMATELTVTIEPDEPDMLEYALDNGIMPVVCGYLPPSTLPCQCKVLGDDKKEQVSGGASSGSFKPSGYGYSGYGYGNSGYGSGGYSGYGYGSKGSGSSSQQEPTTESSDYETVYTYATEDKIADWKGSGSSGSGSSKKKRKGSRVSEDLSLELRQADQVSSST